MLLRTGAPSDYLLFWAFILALFIVVYGISRPDRYLLHRWSGRDADGEEG